MTNLTHKRIAEVFIILCLWLTLSAIRAEGAGSRAVAPSSPASGNCLPATTTANEMNRVIYQEFPANGPTETAWTIVWTEFSYFGLWIEGAWFTPKPGATPIQVLGQTGLSNIFVPYHDGMTTKRFYDINAWADIREAILAYVGPCGTISGPALPSYSLASPSNTSPPRRILIKEIRERGVAWTSNGYTRRGEELLLWAVIDTGNYEYIIQYGFRDDGTITFRLGSTGYNNPGMHYMSHMHNALWYIDVNLGSAGNNSVSLMKHVEPGDPNAPNVPNDPSNTCTPSSPNPLAGMDCMLRFNGGVEGFADWNDKEFTGLNIFNTLVKNAQGITSATT